MNGPTAPSMQRLIDGKAARGAMTAGLEARLDDDDS